MTKNPFLNALTASFYIVFIALVMYFGTKNLPKEDSLFAPIAVISLFTLSAAIMGFVFGYNPLLLILDGKAKQAVHLFLQTVLIFGVFTALSLGLLFFGVFR